MKYVLTGDISNFTLIQPEGRAAFISSVHQLLLSWVEKPLYTEIFRGDSFQLLLNNARDVLRRAIQLRCWIKSHAINDVKLDVKIAIGVGEIAYFGKSILDADGEAFHLSGRTLDQMANSGLKITTADLALNMQLDVITNLVNVIMDGWTKNQAEVIYWLLENKTQMEMAKELNIAQSAVNNRIKLSQWKEIDKTLNYLSALLSTKNS